jgi:serine/threonine protein kinase
MMHVRSDDLLSYFLYFAFLQTRDIKAENLFVTDKWKVKLGDFGESREILRVGADSSDRDSTQWQQQRMTVLGTVAYMAPELVNAEKTYTEAIDVYAMGVTMWEIWSGLDPFARENTFSLYQLIAQGVRPAVPPSCPPGLKTVIEDAWGTTAERRPSAADIAMRMDVVIDDFLSEVLPGSRVEQGEEEVEEHVSPSSPSSSASLQLTTNKVLHVLARDVKSDFLIISGSDEYSEIPFQHDDTYSDGCSNTAANQTSYANPLKQFFQ